MMKQSLCQSKGLTISNLSLTSIWTYNSNLDAVTGSYNIKGLRRLCQLVESNVRGLTSLGVPPELYGSLLSLVLMNKLQQELRLLVSHDIKDGEWELDLLMRVTEREIDARERLNTNPMQPPRK